MARNHLKDDPTRLTARQEKILCYCVQENLITGSFPGIRDVGDALDISSTNGVQDHFRALERKGYLCVDNKHRGMKLTDLGWEYGEAVHMFGFFEQE